MKGLIPEHTGLMGFLKDVIFKRSGSDEAQKKTAREAAYKELYDGGVVAVGDIANSADTLDIRAQGLMYLHTFVECLGFDPDRAQQSFDYSLDVYNTYAAQGAARAQQSMVPHAPYSVSDRLFGLISAHEPGRVMSLHNQETPDEDAYYRDKTGGVSGLLQAINIDDSGFVPTGNSSLQSYMNWLQGSRPLLLVHNTCSTPEDVQHAIQGAQPVYWCLCPNANLYIENRLPDIPMLMAAGAVLCVGTDSLSSNHRLSVLSELQTIRQHFPEIGWEQLLQWATWNGAGALQVQDRYGSLAAGQQPGILLLSNDYSTVRRLF